MRHRLFDVFSKSTAAALTVAAVLALSSPVAAFARGNGDLRHDQDVAQADANTGMPQPPARRAGTGLFQRGSEIDAGALQGGRQAEEQPADDREGERETQYLPVDGGVQSELVAAGGPQARGGPDPPSRHQHAECPA